MNLAVVFSKTSGGRVVKKDERGTEEQRERGSRQRLASSSPNGSDRQQRVLQENVPSGGESSVKPSPALRRASQALPVDHHVRAAHRSPFDVDHGFDLVRDDAGNNERMADVTCTS